MMTDEIIERLSQKLATVRKRDKKRALFCAGSPFGYGSSLNSIHSAFHDDPRGLGHRGRFAFH